MAITVDKINTKGAIVTLGGAVNSVDPDGYYWGTTGGTDVGCTTGGITVSYSVEKNDIYCDQALAPVTSALTGETAEVSLSMLETDVERLKLAIQNSEYLEDAGVARKIGVGGKTGVTYIPLMLEVADENTGLLTTWTFYRVLAAGIEINFERDNPTQVTVTFTAYADTTHAEGHQLFSIHEALT